MPEVLEEAGFGFYAGGIMEKLAETPYDDMIAGEVVWGGTPDDIGERIAAVIEKCAGLAETSITVNAGGFEHWKATKAQQLFAETIIPRFRDRAVSGTVGAGAGDQVAGGPGVRGLTPRP